MGKKVLIIDDSPSVRQQAGFILQKAGFDVVEAADGLEGLSQVEANADLGLIVCDINMPNMDGLTMLGELKKKSISLPIIILTTEGGASKINEAKALGAKAFMVKPFEPDSLTAAVDKLIA